MPKTPETPNEGQESGGEKVPVQSLNVGTEVHMQGRLWTVRERRYNTGVEKVLYDGREFLRAVFVPHAALSRAPNDKEAQRPLTPQSGDYIHVPQQGFISKKDGKWTQSVRGDIPLAPGFYKVEITNGKTLLLVPEGRVEVDVPSLLRTATTTRTPQQRAALSDGLINFGWKLHLHFDASDNIKKTRVESVLRQLLRTDEIKEYKIGSNSGQTGKEATVVVGSKDRAIAVSAKLENLLKNDLSDPPADGDTMQANAALSPSGRIRGRFWAAKDAFFHRYGINGIPILITDDRGRSKRSSQEKIRIADARLRELYGEYYTGTPPRRPQESVERAGEQQ